MNTEQRIVKARIRLILDEPFFGTLLLNLKQHEDKRGITQTMATDGVSLWWNAKFVESLTDDQLKTVLAHETMHAATGHQHRVGKRDHRVFNQAADFVVNNILDNCNITAKSNNRTPPFPFPEGALIEHKYDGMSAEEVYNLIYSEPPPQGGGNGKPGQGGKGNGQGQQQQQPGANMGDVLPAPGDQAEQDQQEANWKVVLTQAAQAAKQHGSLPGDIARMVEEMLNPKASWQEILRRFIRDNAKDDYTWTRPNPRYAATGCILPSLHSQRLGPIAIAVDTSGSIGQKELSEFMAEINSIMHECRPSKVILIDCDARINSVREFEATDTIPSDGFTGGGGTDFSPVTTYLNEQAEQPVCLIYLTDLFGNWGDEPAYPVLWCSKTEDVKVPFGELVSIK